MNTKARLQTDASFCVCVCVYDQFQTQHREDGVNN